MAINNNKPVQATESTLHKYNKVIKTAVEAVADQIHDADGDQTGFQDVKDAFNQLSPAEKAVASVGSLAVVAGAGVGSKDVFKGALGAAAALPVVSLVSEEAIELGHKAVNAIKEHYKNPPEKPLADQLEKGLHKAGGLGQKAAEAVKEHYQHPPEKPLADQLEKGLKKAGDKIEETVDDLKDGRTARDVKKSVQRGIRDHLHHPSETDKVVNAIHDALEDAGDAIGDFIDDVQDGRIQRKIRHALED